MGIIIDSTSQASTTTNASSQTISHTVGAGSNKALIVQTVCRNNVSPGNSTVTGITFNGAALTRAVYIHTGDLGGLDLSAEIWYLLNPTSTTANVVISYTGTVDELHASVISAFGVAQSSPVDVVDDTTGNPHDTVAFHHISLDTTVNGALLVDSIFIGDHTGAIVQTDQTRLLNPTVAQGPGTSYKLVGGANEHLIGWATTHPTSSFHVAAAFKPADEPTLMIIRPNGAGNQQGWDAEGGDYTRVDESSSDGDTTRLYTPTDDKVATFAMENPTPDGTINNVRVVINTRGLDPVDNSVQLAVRTGGTDYFSSTKTYRNTSYHLQSAVWTTNPDTTSAWDWSEINALEAGMKRITGGGQAVTQVWAEIDYTAAAPSGDAPSSLTLLGVS